MPADAGDDGEDPVIRAERAHLATSRDYLRLMRENVLAINPMAGDPVSLEFLKADLYHRAESLRDLPDAPLFFGRLDYREEPWDAPTGYRLEGERNLGGTQLWDAHAVSGPEGEGDPRGAQHRDAHAGSVGPGGPGEPGGYGGAGSPPMRGGILGGRPPGEIGPGGHGGHGGTGGPPMRGGPGGPGGSEDALVYGASSPGGHGGRAAPHAGGHRGGFAPRESTELTLHIGRRHVHDQDGTPVVIDWRAPVSRPFYRASQAEPLGLALRRRFGFSGGELTAYEDERFASMGARGGATFRSEEIKPSKLLIAEIERPRSGPMRDIVATIQPEQDDIVRADVGQTVCVQGAPGTGKTAVGLHRVAYLLYAHKEQVTRRGVIVVGPNPAFLSYVRNVLPALGELDVTQTTITDLVASAPARGADSDEAALVKGDARMAEVLRRALWASVRAPAQALVVARGSRRWRVPAHEIESLAAELRERGVRYGAGRELLGHRIAHVILTQMEAAGETCDDRTHDAVRRSAPVRACVAEVWPKMEAKRLVFGLLSSSAELARHASGLLTEAEQKAIVWSPAPRGPGSARWSHADLVLIDEAADLIERTPSLAHVVLDEAQDLSPMQCRAIGRRCTTGSATVLGDIAQGTTPWAATSWSSLLAHLGKPDASVRELDVGYRVPRQILDYASRLLPSIAPALRPAASLREDPGALAVEPVPPGSLGDRVATACSRALELPGSVAVICADTQVSEVRAVLLAAGLVVRVLGAETADGQARLTVVPVTLAKGLEFDHVVLAEPARIASGEAYGLRRLYVALTRAVSRLTVLHVEPLPGELRSVP